MKIDIPKPCHEDWFAMTPGEQLRLCGICRQNVIDIAAMSESEAIIAVKKPETCAGLEFNSEGRIRTRSGFSSALLLAAGLSMACSGSEENEETNSKAMRSAKSTEQEQQSVQTKPQDATPPAIRPPSVEEESPKNRPVRMGKVRLKNASSNKRDK